MGLSPSATVARGDGRNPVQRLDLRHAETLQRGVRDGASGQDESHQRRQEEDRFAEQTIYKSDAELLAGLRRLLEERGKLSEIGINESFYLPSIEPYVRRFGSLSEAFEKIGYVGPKLIATKTKRVKRALRDGIIAQAVATDPSRITLVQSDRHFRPRLRVLGLLVSVLVCRYLQDNASNPRWTLSPVPRSEIVLRFSCSSIPGTRLSWIYSWCQTRNLKPVTRSGLMILGYNEASD